MVLHLAKWKVIDKVINGIERGGKDGVKDKQLLEIIESYLSGTKFEPFMKSPKELVVDNEHQSSSEPNEKTQWYATALKKMAWMNMSVQEAFSEMKPLQYETQCNIDISYTASLSNSLLLSVFTAFKGKVDVNDDDVAHHQHRLPSKQCGITPMPNLSGILEGISEDYGESTAEKILKVTLPSGEVKFLCYCHQNESGEIVFYRGGQSSEQRE